MPGALWFPGSRLNYAEHIFARRDPGKTAIISKTEGSELRTMTWEELRRKTGAFAESLKGMGVEKGDRVAAYLPNVPETVVSFLACASIGAIWSSCAPDFGGAERRRQVQADRAQGADRVPTVTATGGSGTQRPTWSTTSGARSRASSGRSWSARPEGR